MDYGGALVYDWLCDSGTTARTPNLAVGCIIAVALLFKSSPLLEHALPTADPCVMLRQA